MKSLARCIDAVPAEGYTECHHRPSVKLTTISTAPTAVTLTRKKDLLNCRFPPGRFAVGAYDGGRYRFTGGRQPATIPPERKPCKTLHYGRCGRCGRYFADFVIVVYVKLLCHTYRLPICPHSGFKRPCSR